MGHAALEERVETETGPHVFSVTSYKQWYEEFQPRLWDAMFDSQLRWAVVGPALQHLTRNVSRRNHSLSHPNLPQVHVYAVPASDVESKGLRVIDCTGEKYAAVKPFSRHIDIGSTRISFAQDQQALIGRIDGHPYAIIDGKNGFELHDVVPPEGLKGGNYQFHVSWNPSTVQVANLGRSVYVKNAGTHLLP